jgi:hypothetical protein
MTMIGIIRVPRNRGARPARLELTFPVGPFISPHAARLSGTFAKIPAAWRIRLSVWR